MDLTVRNYRRALRSIRPRPRGPCLSQETTLLPGFPVALTGALQRSSLVQPRFLRGERDSPAFLCFVSLTFSTINSLYFSSSLSYFSSLLFASQRRSTLPICERRKGAISPLTWNQVCTHSQLDCDCCWAWAFSCFNSLVVGVRLSLSIPFSFNSLLVRPWIP